MHSGILDERIFVRTAAVALALGLAASSTAQQSAAQQSALQRATTNAQPVTPNVAVADISPTEGSNVRGRVTFTSQAHSTKVELSLSGLETGRHAVHVHEHGDCSAPDASSAGGHFSPDDDPHGAPSDQASLHHAGDLGNFIADSDGRIESEVFDEELDITGRYAVVGRAVIVHSGADDLETQPSGEAGDRVACGVIEPVLEPAQ